MWPERSKPMTIISHVTCSTNWAMVVTHYPAVSNELYLKKQAPTPTENLLSGCHFGKANVQTQHQRCLWMLASCAFLACLSHLRAIITRWPHAAHMSRLSPFNNAYWHRWQLTLYPTLYQRLDEEVWTRLGLPVLHATSWCKLGADNLHFAIMTQNIAASALWHSLAQLALQSHHWASRTAVE